ncbi:unnamed protein product [Rotaria sp. Silwood2]|nr:unnamed protein product [Rotaria sp. Silwood2]
MIFCYFKLIVVFHLTNEQQRNYNFFMPDLPSRQSSLSSPLSPIIRKSHSFTAHTFTKINLLSSPINVKLYHHTNINNNYTSVDVETEQLIHKFILIDIEQNDILTICMIENSNIPNETNITLFIMYQQLNELHIDGYIKLCGQIHVISSGIGNIYITAIDEINITLSGIGTIYYSGPLKEHINTGLGSILEIPNVLSSNDQ